MAVIKMNFLSKSLGMQTNVTICIPSMSFKDIQEDKSDVYVQGMKYQVLWLLHGGSGDDSDYLNFSNITRYADDNKLAVVMPADYNMSYTDFEDGPKFMSFIADELPKMCQAIFPFSDKREDNFIGGLSMGAGGCQKIAMHYPEKYAAVLVMSGGGFHIRKDTPLKFGGGLPMGYRPKGVEEKNMELARKHIESGVQVPKFFMTWGDKDFVREGQRESCEFLRKLGYDVYEEEVAGYGHEWDFWDLTLRKAINEWLPIRHSIIYPEP